MRREDLRTDNQQTAGDVNQTEIRMISIVIQAFYGNRTGTEVYIDNLDRLILGDIDTRYPLMPYQRIDRTIIKLPGRDNVVLIYNKYEEERSLNNCPAHSRDFSRELAGPFRL